MNTSWLKRWTHTIVACPHCHQSLRLPKKTGATLLVRCQRCTSQFNVKMQNPLRQLFRKSSFSVLQRLAIQVRNDVLSRSRSQKILIILVFLSIVYLITMFTGFLTSDKRPSEIHHERGRATHDHQQFSF